MSSTREIFTNPLESGRNSSTTNQRGMVDASISSATCINPITFQQLTSRLTLAESNEERLTMLEQEKTQFLFTSTQLLTIIEITPSIKTRLSMITMIGPRLTDPRAKVFELMGLFRYSEEKERVQEVLKARTQVLASSLFKPSGLSAAIVGASSSTTTTSTDGNPPTSAVKSALPAFEIKGLAGVRPRTTTQNTTTKPRSSSNAPPIAMESIMMMNSSTTTATTATTTSSTARPSHSNQQIPNTAISSSQKISMDRDRILSSTEVQQLSQSIRSKGKVKAMIQAFSKGNGTGSTTQGDEEDNSPTLSSSNNGQTNSQVNSHSGTPEDSPRYDESSSYMKNSSPSRPVNGKISNKETGYVPHVPPPSASQSHNYPSNKETIRSHREINLHNDNNMDKAISSAKNDRKNHIDRSPSDDSGFGGNLPPHTRTPLTTQNKAWSFFGMDFSCMSFTFGSENNSNNNYSGDDDDHEKEQTPSDVAAEESRCIY